MSQVISIIAFILIVGLLIFIHEFGHFFLAKLNGIAVTEFSIGMGPKLFSWTRKGTLYAVRILPIGGYCSMLGNETVLPGEKKEADTEEEAGAVCEDDRSFQSKPVLRRISVILAGPVFNFLLALVMAFLLVALVGTTTTKISGVSEGYPAYEAGLQAGDEITRLDHTPVHLFKDITLYMSMHEGEEITVEYERDGKRFTTVLKPQYDTEEQRYLIGIYAPARTENLNVFQVFQYGFYEFGFNTGAVIKSLGMLFAGKLDFNSLSGPVGIAGTVNDIVSEVDKDTEGEDFFTKAYWVFVNLLSFAVLISSNLGVMNLLPIPGLDGGKLIFLIIEGVIRRPVPKKYEGIVTLIGVVLLLLLIVAVFFNDIRKVFFG